MKLNKYLIGVVIHQMVTRGYNVLEMQMFDLFISDKNGNIIEEIESEIYCIPYCGLPCCSYCGDCFKDTPLCLIEGKCHNCGDCQ